MGIGLIIDLIIILFVTASVYLGYRKGLISVAVSLIAFIAAILITIILYKPVANFIIDNTDWDKRLQQTIASKVDDITTSNSEEKNLTDDLIEGAKNEVLPETSKNIAINIIYGGTMIGLFIASRLLLLLINLMSEAITSLPIIKQFNEAGGIAYGLLRGVLIVYAILMIINLIISSDPDGTLNGIVQSSIITKFLINYNVFSLFFK